MFIAEANQSWGSEMPDTQDPEAVLDIAGQVLYDF